MGGFRIEISAHRVRVQALFFGFQGQVSELVKKCGYQFSKKKAEWIHAYSRTVSATMPCTEAVMKMVTIAAEQLNSMLETLSKLRHEMDDLSSKLPEYDVVMSLFGVGNVFCSQLIAEIGDVRHLKSSKSLVALAGIDPPPDQSGKHDAKSRSISKCGSPFLRKTLFQIMTIYLQQHPINEPVYQFLDKKRSEGKPYRVYMIAAAHKFLKIYYTRVIEALT